MAYTGDCTSPSKPQLLTPDYFRTKLIVTGSGGTTAAASSQPIESETREGPPSPSKPSSKNSVQTWEDNQPPYCTGRQPVSQCRTRSTPVAEAAIKREQENNKKKETATSLDCAAKEEKPVLCDIPLTLKTSATRDWSGWTLNDLDTDDIQTTKPFVESVTACSTYSSAGIDPCHSWGQSVFTDASPTVTHSSEHHITTQSMENARSVRVLTDDELFAHRLQNEEYSKDNPLQDLITGQDDWHIARVYQQDLDATAAMELQQQETQYDAATGTSYSKPPTTGPVFARHRPSSPTTGQHTRLEGGSVSAHDQDCYLHGRSEESSQALLHPTDNDWHHQQAQYYESASSSGTRMPPVFNHGGAALQPHNIDMSYEALLALEDVARGVSRKVLDHCTSTRSFKEKDAASSEHKTCTICLAVFREGQLVRYLPCLHSFHCYCIDQWLEQHSTCPVCMKSIEELHMRMTVT